MFLQRQILFGLCMLFYLLNLMFFLQASKLLDSNHTGFSPCMVSLVRLIY